MMPNAWCAVSVLSFFILLVPSLTLPAEQFEYYDDHAFPPKGENLKKVTTGNFHPFLRSAEKNSLQDGTEFWINVGLDALSERLKVKERKGIAKNVILFIGDGMSVPTLAAARIFKGQKEGGTGEESSLSFEKFPFTGLSKTYCVDSQVADSACSATAYLNAVKGNIETIGVTGSVKKFDCEAMNNRQHHTSSIASWAQAAGKATGLVTTTRVTHASPSGVYAHTAHRTWEYDKPISESGNDPEKCWDITKQLVLNEPGKNLKVILGGGRGTFLPNVTKDPEYNKTGWRTDGRNLINEWLEDKKTSKVSATYLWNRVGLMKSKYEDSDYLLGLFEPSHMQYHLNANEMTEPTLEEMTEIAIKKLSKEKNGFFLFVEGGKIDLAHHDNLAKVAFDETLEFDKAIQKARQMTSEEDTLIVVTADHAHTMSFSGYPDRGSDILATLQMGDIDGLPYSTISYANGPGYKQSMNVPQTRYNLSQEFHQMKESHYMFPALLPLKWETHGGDDVAVFASGPWSHLFVGNYEQNVIPLAMAYAARIGPSQKIHIDNLSSNANALHPHCCIYLILTLFLYFCMRTIN